MILRRLFLLLFLSVSLQTGYAATITSTAAGGEWNTPATWIGGVVPNTNDVVIIQATATVTLTNTILGTSGARRNLNITVNGTLSLIYTGGVPLIGASGMWLTSGSIINIAAGGQLTSSSNNPTWDANFISIGTSFFDFDYFGETDGTITGPAVINSGGVLPIELISFNASLSGESILITWATATELNNALFTIERSQDGLTWSVIGETPGAGNSTSRIDYEYYDNRPIPGFLYYRLKQTDYDGQFEYFKAAVVRYEPENLFRVYPNPSTGPLTIITSGELTNAKIFIYDASGKSFSIPMDKTRH